MRHTLMINLDEAHAVQLDELRQHFRLSAEDTVRLAIRTAHAMHRKGNSAPECKPQCTRYNTTEKNDPSPQ